MNKENYDNNKSDELLEVSMKILLIVGDVRNELKKALNLAKEFNIEEARESLKKAKELFIDAHRVQTNIIQQEASENPYPYSPLFTHAQDHIMTIQSELNISAELIDILEIISKK